MIKLFSNKNYDMLIKEFDERTSEARFAGNDEILDNIFVTERKGDRFILIHKAKALRDPFAAIFHGRISKTVDGTCISGYFTKSVLDYIITALFFVFLMIIRDEVISRGESPLTVNVIIAIYMLLALSFLLTFKSTKQKYIDFFKDITD